YEPDELPGCSTPRRCLRFRSETARSVTRAGTLSRLSVLRRLHAELEVDDHGPVRVPGEEHDRDVVSPVVGHDVLLDRGPLSGRLLDRRLRDRLRRPAVPRVVDRLVDVVLDRR